MYGIETSRMMSVLCSPAASDRRIPVSLIMASSQRPVRVLRKNVIFTNPLQKTHHTERMLNLLKAVKY